MGFAERQGFVREKAVQLYDMDNSLRNRLYNVIHKNLDHDTYIYEELEYVVDHLGYQVKSSTYENWFIIDSILLRTTKNIPWYMPYEVIELFYESKKEKCNKCVHSCRGKMSCGEMSGLTKMSVEINLILEQEKAGYRILDGRFVNITSEEELVEISSASNSPYESVNTHFKKALVLYSDRKNPDYENSIKESISAVEAMCCTITGATGSQATLGNTLKKLEDKGLVIHGAMKSGFEKMYGYTSDADGIRHGGIDFTNAPAEDAKYMLVSCSAFVNYLVEKYSKVK